MNTATIQISRLLPCALKITTDKRKTQFYFPLFETIIRLAYPQWKLWTGMGLNWPWTIWLHNTKQAVPSSAASDYEASLYLHLSRYHWSRTNMLIGKAAYAASHFEIPLFKVPWNRYTMMFFSTCVPVSLKWGQELRAQVNSISLTILQWDTNTSMWLEERRKDGKTTSRQKYLKNMGSWHIPSMSAYAT